MKQQQLPDEGSDLLRTENMATVRATVWGQKPEWHAFTQTQLTWGHTEVNVWRYGGRRSHLGDAFQAGYFQPQRSFSGRHSRDAEGTKASGGSLRCLWRIIVSLSSYRKVAPGCCGDNGDSWRLTKTSEEASV